MYLQYCGLTERANRHAQNNYIDKNKIVVTFVTKLSDFGKPAKLIKIKIKKC